MKLFGKKKKSYILFEPEDELTDETIKKNYGQIKKNISLQFSNNKDYEIVIIENVSDEIIKSNPKILESEIDFDNEIKEYYIAYYIKLLIDKIEKIKNKVTGKVTPTYSMEKSMSSLEKSEKDLIYIMCKDKKLNTYNINENVSNLNTISNEKYKQYFNFEQIKKELNRQYGPKNYCHTFDDFLIKKEKKEKKEIQDARLEEFND